MAPATAPTGPSTTAPDNAPNAASPVRSWAIAADEISAKNSVTAAIVLFIRNLPPTHHRNNNTGGVLTLCRGCHIHRTTSAEPKHCAGTLGLAVSHDRLAALAMFSKVGDCYRRRRVLVGYLASVDYHREQPLSILSVLASNYRNASSSGNAASSVASPSSPISGDRCPDDVRLSDTEPRFVCTTCGKLADV
jgi:hypothetical protein